ncbi:hypothetical protein Bca52824_046050 [Brassica carinata]|uniref:Uncharacterized protein n=1 Tax=Brassica carinata TaxID=52824 RepID=A0A8X7US36_BRACI|nr:hypothetical protein Bca52824_046050 [Brassica carinata]
MFLSPFPLYSLLSILSTIISSFLLLLHAILFLFPACFLYSAVMSFPVGSSSGKSRASLIGETLQLFEAHTTENPEPFIDEIVAS